MPWLLAAVLVALVAVAGLTTISARLATRHPPGEILRSETGRAVQGGPAPYGW